MMTCKSGPILYWSACMEDIFRGQRAAAALVALTAEVVAAFGLLAAVCRVAESVSAKSGRAGSYVARRPRGLVNR